MLLYALKTGSDHYQAAQPLIASETNAGVDAVYPHVDVVSLGEVAGLEALVLGLPALTQTGDGSCRQSSARALW